MTVLRAERQASTSWSSSSGPRSESEPAGPRPPAPPTLATATATSAGSPCSTERHAKDFTHLEDTSGDRQGDKGDEQEDGADRRAITPFGLCHVVRRVLAQQT